MSRIMAHLVAHYPDAARSRAVARGLIRGGASSLEIQFPFSDPTADGPVIQKACQDALDTGFSVDEGFAFVKYVADEIKNAGRDVPIFVMSYASLIYARGVQTFLKDGMDAGATGYILPDIPIDYDEGVWDAAQSAGASIMPVTVTTADHHRVELIMGKHPEYVYVALRRGTTGAKTELDADIIAVLDRLRESGAKVMAGFGISEAEQVEALDPHVHSAVVGSELVRTVTSNATKSEAEIEEAVADRMRRLIPSRG